MQTRMYRQNGFTIVELLIVIVVIAILAAISIVAYNGIQNRSKDAKVSTEVSNVKKAIELYKIDNGFYPSIGNDDAGYSFSGLSVALVPTYMSSLPSDYGLYQYVRGPVANDSYGILVRNLSKPNCKTGVNVNAGWWGASVLSC